MLTVEQMSRILLEVTMGAPPSIRGKEAAAMRAKFEVEVAEIAARGQHVEIPFDWEIPDDFGTPRTKPRPKKKG